MSTDDSGLLETLVEVVNALVELYLAHVIKPFLLLHEKFYNKLNKVIRSLLDDNCDKIPSWFTANFITYFRTWMVIPCVILMVKDYTIIPSLLVLSVDLGDFLDGVVARFWVDRSQIESVGKDVDGDDKDGDETKGKKKLQSSWIIQHREKNYGGFIDAICDKAFVVPCWISLLSSVPDAGYVNTFQFIVLWCLILTETASGCIRFRAYYTSNGIPAPAVKGLNFSSSAVKADHIGKAKQTFEMVGTALFILPFMRYAGLVLLSAAIPLAYESVRRKISKRIIYVAYGASDKFDHETLKFWKQAKNLGSKLIVGISENDEDMIKNANASESVDSVLLNAPTKVSLEFMKDMGIDYVVCGDIGVSVITTELTEAKRCIVLLDDKNAMVMESKSVKTE